MESVDGRSLHSAFALCRWAVNDGGGGWVVACHRNKRGKVGGMNVCSFSDTINSHSFHR